eukprot:ANDGO_06863.mRNA.1 G-type lectin S-receptor-like serine/threonine-protein kinase LECRK1
MNSESLVLNSKHLLLASKLAANCGFTKPGDELTAEQLFSLWATHEKRNVLVSIKFVSRLKLLLTALQLSESSPWSHLASKFKIGIDGSPLRNYILGDDPSQRMHWMIQFDRVASDILLSPSCIAVPESSSATSAKKMGPSQVGPDHSSEEPVQKTKQQHSKKQPKMSKPKPGFIYRKPDNSPEPFPAVPQSNVLQPEIQSTGSQTPIMGKLKREDPVSGISGQLERPGKKGKVSKPDLLSPNNSSSLADQSSGGLSCYQDIDLMRRIPECMQQYLEDPPKSLLVLVSNQELTNAILKFDHTIPPARASKRELVGILASKLKCQEVFSGLPRQILPVPATSWIRPTSDRQRFLIENYKEIITIGDIEIGRGAFGVVFKGEMKDDLQNDHSETVAVKKIQVSLSNREKVEKELDNLILSCGSEYCVPFIGYYEHECKVHFVSAYMQSKLSMEIPNLLKDKKATSLVGALHIVLQVGRALQFLHGERYAHLDVKPHNILICGQQSARLCDFGTLCGATEEQHFTTRGYHPPEYFGDLRRLDLYGLGVCLYQILRGSLTFPPSDVRHDLGDHWAVRECQGLLDIVLACLDTKTTMSSSTIVERLFELIEQLSTKAQRRIVSANKIVEFVRQKVDHSKAHYYVGKRVRYLSEWRRVRMMQQHLELDLGKLTEEQIVYLASILDIQTLDGFPIKNSSFNLRKLNHPQSDERDTGTIYIYRHCQTGMGYVGQTSDAQSFGQRHKSHRNGSSLFDRSLKRNENLWERAIVAQGLDLYSRNRLEILFIIILNTVFFFPDEPGNGGLNQEIGGLYNMTIALNPKTLAMLDH